MNFWIGIIVSSLFLVATVVIFATKFLYPYHRITALVIYAIGWIPFLYSMLLRKRWILEHKGTVTTFFSAYGIHIIFGLILIVSMYVFLTIFPVAKSPFLGMSDKSIAQAVNEDRTVLFFLDQRLTNSFNKAKKENIFSVDFKHITPQEKSRLTDFWQDYVEVLLELDVAKERYKTFYQINAVTEPELHQKAFQNAYLAFLSQYYHAFQLVSSIDNPNLIKYFNQDFMAEGFANGTFDMLKNKLTNPQEVIRLNAGRAYISVLKNNDQELTDKIDEYLKIIDSSKEEYATLAVKSPLDLLEKNSFQLWFPIQKNVALNLSYIRATSRDYHIDSELIRKYKEQFLPGDIFLERREWHATNIGIPGYWTHAALYLGTLDELNAYFQDIAELKGESFEQFVAQKFPEAYKKFQEKTSKGDQYAVIESKRPGVILMSLEDTANADSMVALRVKNIAKTDRFKIVTQALSHYGKSYDYDFDFTTDSTLVCSELVYKAYSGIDALAIELQEFNGHLLVSPNQFAQKFDQEFGSEQAELELILFLDGNEKTKTAVEKSAEAFRASWQRPKWHIAKDYLK